MKILFVCLGNICRSPLAEGIMRNLVKKHGLDWVIDSAGTGSWHVGESPDFRAIHIADKFGVDISGLCARQFKPSDFDEFDRIVVMDASNHRDVLRLASAEHHKSKVSFLLNHIYPDENRAVPDPWFDDDLFEPVYHLLVKACQKIVEENQ